VMPDTFNANYTYGSPEFDLARNLSFAILFYKHIKEACNKND